MASKILWTDQTWNPIIGCSKVSPGCANCYAERMALRQAHMEYARLEKHLNQDLDAKDGIMKYVGVVDISKKAWNGKTVFVESALTKPLHWRKPRMIFVCSMSDLFHESVPFEWIDKVFAIMALCPQHTFQILTKRPERMFEYLDDVKTRINIPAAASAGAGVRVDLNRFWTAAGWPIKNIWLGCTAENQAMADKRIPVLLQCPAAKRFVSVEPMLGKVDLAYTCFNGADSFGTMPGLDWVICGGESGPGARPMHPDWVRSLRDQCKEAGVPFMFKQWGEWTPSHVAGGHISKGQISLSFDGVPYSDYVCASTVIDDNCQGMSRVGKKKTGRLLDGVEHNGFPEKAEQ